MLLTTGRHQERQLSSHDNYSDDDNRSPQYDKSFRDAEPDDNDGYGPVRPNNHIVDPSLWQMSEPLRAHVHCCHVQHQKMEQQRQQRRGGPSRQIQKSTLSVLFLGTGTSYPAVHRANSCTAVRCRGKTAGVYLIDAGSSAHMQLIQSGVAPSSIRTILITRMCGDHVCGLPPLLTWLHMNHLKTRGKRNKIRRKHRGKTVTAFLEEDGQGVESDNDDKEEEAEELPLIKIYGPPGLHQYLSMSLSLTHAARFKAMRVVVHELLPGGYHDNRHPNHHLRRHRGEEQQHFHPGLGRRDLPQNPDGTWTCQVAQEITTPEQALEEQIAARNSPHRGLHVQAAAVQHAPNLLGLGYALREPDTQLRNIIPEACRELGIAPGDSYKLLKAGFAVANDAKTALVHPHQVCKKVTKPRKVVACGDCGAVPPELTRLSAGADVVIHEATRAMEERGGTRRGKFGRATPAAAGRFAKITNARVLALNRIPGRVSSTAAARETLRQALAACQPTSEGSGTQAVLTQDFMELSVPRGGFDFVNNNDNSNSNSNSNNEDLNRRNEEDAKQQPKQEP